jgi:hypothetical protein
VSIEPFLVRLFERVLNILFGQMRLSHGPIPLSSRSYEF